MGPRFDRRWMVVGADGVFISQRGRPELATVRATVAGGELILEAPGAGALAVPVAPEGGRVGVRVWDSELEVRAVSRAADAWFTAFLGTPHRLVHIGNDDVRPTDPAYAEGHRVGFADGYPALLVTQGSGCGTRQARRPPDPGGALPPQHHRFRRTGPRGRPVAALHDRLAGLQRRQALHALQGHDDRPGVGRARPGPRAAPHPRALPPPQGQGLLRRERGFITRQGRFGWATRWRCSNRGSFRARDRRLAQHRPRTARFRSVSRVHSPLGIYSPKGSYPVPGPAGRVHRGCECR